MMNKERLQEHIDAFDKMTSELSDRDILRLTIKKSSGRSYILDLEKDDTIISASLTHSLTIKIEK